jgi:hypothetical protein
VPWRAFCQLSNATRSAQLLAGTTIKAPLFVRSSFGVVVPWLSAVVVVLANGSMSHSDAGSGSGGTTTSAFAVEGLRVGEPCAGLAGICLADAAGLLARDSLGGLRCATSGDACANGLIRSSYESREPARLDGDGDVRASGSISQSGVTVCGSLVSGVSRVAATAGANGRAGFRVCDALSRCA